MYFEKHCEDLMNLEQSLLHRKCSINVSYFHSIPLNNTVNNNLQLF